MNKQSKVVACIIVALFLVNVVSAAEREDATDYTLRLENDDYVYERLSTEINEPVALWIEEIEGANGSESHPIDVYIASSDEWVDYGCYGDDNWFAESFEPSYSAESLDLTNGTYYIEWTPPSEDSYYVIFDNCDNQLESDYNEIVTPLIITFAINDMSDEYAEAVAGFLGGLGIITLLGIGACCVLPFLIIVFLLVRRNKAPQVIVSNSEPVGYNTIPQQATNIPTQFPSTQPVQVPVKTNPSPTLNGTTDANGYEWLTHEGSQYWRQGIGQPWTEYNQ